MHKKVIEEYQRVSALTGIEITEDLLKKNLNNAMANMLRQSLTKEHLKRMLQSARPLGDFGFFMKNMSNDDFQEFFSGPVRKYGLDGSLNFKYGGFGASTSPSILNISPWSCSIDTYEEMRGKPKKSDPDKEDIFDAGHWMEPVYRHYFEKMYGGRYRVIECDIQWVSRVYDHAIINVDGILEDKETGQLGILEIKHTSPRNVPVIDAVKSGEVPAYWDSQERVYMEILGADFSCLFLGWGNRPGLDTNAMVRTERDQDLGEAILDQCEEFMVNNVEAGIKPSYKNVKDPERVKESIEELYGPVNPKKKSLVLDKSFEANLKDLVEAEKALEKAKQKVADAKEEAEKTEAAYKALQVPIIEEMKDAPACEYVDGDGTHYNITYDVRKALNVQKLKDLYPAAYDAYNKPAVDTASLKRGNPEAYSKCFEPKLGSSRTFKMRTWRPKTR